VSSAKRILVPGQTRWRLERASRAAFLVDGERYFDMLAAALERARYRAILLGWDFHSRVALRRNGTPRTLPGELAALLDALARRRRGLRIFVLEWDFAMLYWTEREALRAHRFRARTHRRVRFRFDAECPIGASHHQKLVVVDDALAFAGGLDVTSSRWDTREHAAEEPRRVDPDGQPYAPFHDVQMAVDGAAAKSLGELARERWRRATGQRLAPVQDGQDPWRISIQPPTPWPRASPHVSVSPTAPRS
jgi:phospholipase D1/2